MNLWLGFVKTLYITAEYRQHICKQTIHCFWVFLAQFQNYFTYKKYHLLSVLITISRVINCCLVLTL